MNQDYRIGILIVNAKSVNLKTLKNEKDNTRIDAYRNI